MRMKLKIIFLLIGLTILITSCNGCKNDNCKSGNIQFNIPVQVYGIKDTLSLDDTLRIKIEVPEHLAERNTGITYDFIDYNFKLITYMVKIDTSHSRITYKGDFDWVTLKGQSIYSSTGEYTVNPEYQNNKYSYEVLVVPKKKGLYSFGMNSVFFRASRLQQLEGPCSENEVEIYTKLINDTNVNFEFLKNSPDPSQASIDWQRFEDFAGFCFYVK
jgi:hypothetical protein